MRLALIFVSALAALLCISGCASYQLGSSAEVPFKTLYVEPVTNDSYAPQAQAAVSAKIRDVLIRDGRIQLVTKPEKADAILSVNLTDYTRTGNTRRSVDTERAQDFQVQLKAEVSLFNQTAGSYYFTDRTLAETTYAYADDPYQGTLNTSFGTQSFLAAEYQAMPILARGLARQIADTILSSW